MDRHFSDTVLQRTLDQMIREMGLGPYRSEFIPRALNDYVAISGEAPESDGYRSIHQFLYLCAWYVTDYSDNEAFLNATYWKSLS